jgi:hypothetical protein
MLKNSHLFIFNFNLFSISKTMKRLFIQLLFFAFLFFLYDKICFIVPYFSAQKQLDRRLELVLTNKMNKDIIIIGSSRGLKNILAGQLQKETGLSAYNMSYLGADVAFQDFVLASILKFNKKPKIVLLAIDDICEFHETPLEFRTDVLQPLLHYNYCNDKMVERGLKNRFLSHFFLLHRLNPSNFEFSTQAHTKIDTIMSFGAVPYCIQNTGVNWAFKYNTNYDSTKEVAHKLRAFANIQAQCKAQNIQLVLVFSPNFSAHNTEFDQRIHSLSTPETAVFCYDTSNISYKNKNFFYDESHLLYNGAQVFTLEISNFLKKNK